MTTFIQLHLLTAYAPANLNRDESGRPKTAKMGGVERLRISSQSLKRAWRTSDLFATALAGHVGTRTRRIGRDFVYKPMEAAGINAGLATEAAQKIAAQFGKLKKDAKPKNPLSNLDIEQLVHISKHEEELIKTLVATLIDEKRLPTEDELHLLRKEERSVDMALFGRMLASSPTYNVEAACQVSHPIGVSAVTVENDFFTAVDDVSKCEDDEAAGAEEISGSAHMGDQGFASALFYTYICISRDLLLNNLGGDEALLDKTLAALTETAVKVSPTGKQNSFASRAYASYVLAETGVQQPRSLAVAFFRPVRGDDQLHQAIAELEKQCNGFDEAYGHCAERRFVVNVGHDSSLLESKVEVQTGSMAGLIDFICRR